MPVVAKVTSTHANRSFSKLVADAMGGRTTEITVRGKVVAKLVPATEAETRRDESFRKHLAELRNRPVMNLPRVPREQLYDDD